MSVTGTTRLSLANRNLSDPADPKPIGDHGGLQSIVQMQGTVTANKIAQAEAWVAAQGHGLAAVEAFVDAFGTAAAAGRLPKEARAAYRKALVRLVHKAPEPALSPTTARLSEADLQEQLTRVQGLIGTYRSEISTLETRLGDTLARINTKTRTIDRLLSNRQEYQRTLRQKQNDQQMMMMFAAFGAFGGASTAVGLGSAMSIGELNRQIASLNREISSAQSEKAQFEASVALFRKQQATMATSLKALRQVEKDLASAADAVAPVSQDATHTERIVKLVSQVDKNRALASNLRAQITLLRGMNNHADVFESGLDALTKALEKEVAELEKRNQQAERALLETVIDIVFAQTGTDPNLRIGGLSLSKKRLLLDGLDYMSVAIEQQVNSLVNRMLADGLVDAVGSRQVASAIVRVLRGQADSSAIGVAARQELLNQATAPLSEPQQFLVNALLRQGAGGFDSTELLRLVLANSQITDPQARAMAALLTIPEGPQGGKESALKDMAQAQGLTETQTALRMLRYGHNTASDSSSDEWRQVKEALKPTLRTAAMFVHGPAAQALNRTLEGSGRQSDLALAASQLQSGLFGVQSALRSDAQTQLDAATIILRGWKTSLAGWYVQSKDAASDARTALDDAIALLPEGDPLIDYLKAQAKAYDTFRGSWIDAWTIAERAIDKALEELQSRRQAAA